VEITEDEYRELVDAERIIREAVRGILYRLVFANYRALKDQEARILGLLTSEQRRGFLWLPGEHIGITLAFANWLIS
jgi:hypothetical protein